jgi:hypothetical protein
MEKRKMNKGTIIKYASIIIGALVAISFVSKHPIPVILLGLCACAYFIGVAIEKGKINL